MTAPGALAPDLVEALACPRCHGALEVGPEELRCPQGHGPFPVTSGRAVFLDAEEFDRTIRTFELRTPGGVTKQTRRQGELRARLRRFAWLMGPPIARDPGGAARVARVRRAHEELGGLGVNLGAQGARLWSRLVSLDAEGVEGVEVVADAHELPFGTGQLSLVYSTSLFEHLRRPRRVVEEVRRCLRPGGSCYVEVPWLYELHGCPMDFQRWTQAGLRELFADFEVLDEGCIGGPGAVAARFLRALAFSLTPGRWLRYGARAAATWALFWMKYLDSLIPEARRVPFAQGYWIWVRRPPDES